MVLINFDRRQFLKSLACAAATPTVSFPAPYISIKPKVKLRVLGTHVTLQREIKERAEKELGFQIDFLPGGSAQVLYKASTEPDSFDLYEQWSNSIKILWSSGAIQPIEKARISRWKEVNDLSKRGKIDKNASIGKGDAPVKLLYVQKDGTLSSRNSSQISFLPYVHNADSFGYNATVVPEGKPYDTESWGWLLDEKWRGKVAVVNAPSIGFFDLALAASARNLVTFKNLGNPTRKEIDSLFNVVLRLQERGHFRGVWRSVPESVDMMSKGEVVIESMFSPAVTSLNRKGINCIYAAPNEGYRAWHGVMCLSSAVKSEYIKNAAYDYMNWWLSGWPGAFIARQGYYISNPETSREFLKKEEWDYWYDGKPARTKLPDPSGKIAVAAGSIRRGGSYTSRLSNVAVWNTVIDEYEYLLHRWRDIFL